MVSTHTHLNKATEEDNMLGAVVTYAHDSYPDERDFIVMGNLNIGRVYFDENNAFTLNGCEYYWVIGVGMDTTTKSTD